jgi:hypothetical protein
MLHMPFFRYDAEIIVETGGERETRRTASERMGNLE